jgi:tripartite ATP-independent transporter DctM subunit
MLGLSNPELGVLMLALFVIFIMFGFPIAFTLMALGVFFGYFAMGDLVFNLLIQRTYSVMTNDVLISIPLFIFMGYVVERANILDRLFRSLQLAAGPVPASLALATLATCALFATATGIVGAVVTLMGLLAFPAMLRAGYDVKIASGVVCAGGCLGILIPPSVMLIVMGPVMGVPVNLLYAASFGPGFLLAGMYIAYCMARALINPKLGPPVPVEERITDWWVISREVIIGVVPLTVLTLATLGVIVAGLATSTEAAACGAFGAAVLALCYGKLTWKTLTKASIATMVTSAMVIFLAVASTVFGGVFTKLGSTDLVTRALAGLDWSDTSKLWLIMAVIFLLGWPFEWPIIVFVFLPIFLPVVEKFSFGLSKLELMLWFGTLLAVNLQTAFLSPPVAMAAYYLKSVVPQWSLATIYKGMGDYMVIQVVCLIAVFVWPDVALWLVRLLR